MSKNFKPAIRSNRFIMRFSSHNDTHSRKCFLINLSDLWLYSADFELVSLFFIPTGMILSYA